MSVLSHNDLEAAWIVAGGARDLADIAAAIAQAESGGRTDAILNTAYPKLPGYRPPAKGALPEYSVGLWQINEVAHPSYSTAYLLTQLGNAEAAVAIERARGNFTDWSTFNNDAYKRFLAGNIDTGGGGGGSNETLNPVKTARAFGGWTDLRNSLNKHLPKQLESSKRATATAARLMAHRQGRGR